MHLYRFCVRFLTTTDSPETRAERMAPEPTGEQITLSAFNGELFTFEGVNPNLALVRVNLADLISPAIG